MRQGPVERAEGGAKAGTVPVEAEHGLRPRPPEQRNLLFGQRGAQRRHSLAKPGLGQRDGIHIAFADDQAPVFAMAQRLARRLVAVQHTRLVEERRIAGVQVFRLRIRRQATATERNDPAPRIRDREHQPPAKGIIGLAALVAFLGKAGLQDLRHREALRLQVLGRLAPVIRGKAETVAPPGPRQQAAALQVDPRRRAFCRLQAILEPGRSRLAGRLQALAVVVFLGGFRARLGQAHARFFREFLDRLHEGQAFRLHHEADDVSAHAGGEAFEDALLVVDVETRAFLIGERRQADPFLALLDQLHLAADHIRRPDTGLQFFDKAIRDSDGLGHSGKCSASCRFRERTDCRTAASKKRAPPFGRASLQSRTGSQG